MEALSAAKIKDWKITLLDKFAEAGEGIPEELEALCDMALREARRQAKPTGEGESREGWLTPEEVHSTIWDHLPGLLKGSKEAEALFALERMALAALSQPAKGEEKP